MGLAIPASTVMRTCVPAGLGSQQLLRRSATTRKGIDEATGSSWLDASTREGPVMMRLIRWVSALTRSRPSRPFRLRQGARSCSIGAQDVDVAQDRRQADCQSRAPNACLPIADRRELFGANELLTLGRQRRSHLVEGAASALSSDGPDRSMLVPIGPPQPARWPAPSCAEARYHHLGQHEVANAKTSNGLRKPGPAAASLNASTRPAPARAHPAPTRAAPTIRPLARCRRTPTTGLRRRRANHGTGSRAESPATTC